MGISQESLARIAGITSGTVARAERGEHAPQPETLERIAKALKCGVSDLRGDA